MGLRTGLFPGNYVEFLSADSSKTLDLSSKKTDKSWVNPSFGRKEDILEPKPSFKKMNASEARASLMHKSESLALSAREKTQVPEESIAIIPSNKPALDKSKQPLAAIMNAQSFISAAKSTNLSKNLSEMSLRSNESLAEGPDKNPRVGKRPPLLVSNQAYETGTTLESTLPLEHSTTKGAPPRPVKPIDIRGQTVSNVSPPPKPSSLSGIPKRSQTVDSKPVEPLVNPTEPPKPVIPSRPTMTRQDTHSIPTRPVVAARPESTLSMLADGTPFRPSNAPSKLIDPTNLTPALLDRYRTLFLESDSDRDGFLQGDQVRAIWIRSGLDARSLGLVWNLSDLGDDGLLDLKEFCIGK